MPDVVVDGQVGKGILGLRPAGAWSRASLTGAWGAFRCTLLKDQGRKWLGVRGEGQAGASLQGPLETELRSLAFPSASGDERVSDTSTIRSVRPFKRLYLAV